MPMSNKVKTVGKNEIEAAADAVRVILQVGSLNIDALVKDGVL